MLSISGPWLDRHVHGTTMVFLGQAAERRGGSVTGAPTWAPGCVFASELLPGEESSDPLQNTHASPIPTPSLYIPEW